MAEIARKDIIAISKDRDKDIYIPPETGPSLVSRVPTVRVPGTVHGLGPGGRGGMPIHCPLPDARCPRIEVDVTSANAHVPYRCLYVVQSRL